MTKQRKLALCLIAAVAVILGLQGALWTAGAAAPALEQACPSGCTKPGGTVLIESAADVEVNNEVMIAIQLLSIPDLYGVEIQLSFDPTILQVQDDKPGTVGTQIRPGEFPNPEQGFVVQNAADNEAGTIAYAFSLLSPSPTAIGSGALARIRFKVIAAGSSAVAIERVVIVGADQCCLELTEQDGSVAAVMTGGAVTGIVRAQGRTDMSGIVVSIAGQQATTGPNGAYTITGVTPGTHSISAVLASYVRSDKGGIVVNNGETTQVPETTLLAGDVDNNCLINVFDLVTLGAAFCTSPPADARADFNQDNVINIFDLVLLAGNYNGTCPTPW